MSAPAAAVATLRAFLHARDEALVHAGVAALLAEAPPAALLDAIAARQDVEGAVADESGSGPSARDPVATTTRVLLRAEAVGPVDHPALEAAVGFLVAAQTPEGAWTDPAASDEAATLRRSGAVLGALARTPFARGSALRRGEAWLRERWSVERVQGPCYAPILAYHHVLANLPSEMADEALQWCGRELERGYRSGAFGAVATARVFVRCGARALPGARIGSDELLASLLAAQQPDGGFAALPSDQDEGLGGDPRVDASFDALVALVRLSA